METSDWFFDKYGPNHGPDEEGNHRWVRDKIREKSVPIDETAIILRLPQRHIDLMFDEVIMRALTTGLRGGNMPTKEDTEQPGYIALLALEALARYTASGLVHEGEKLHKDLATRLARVVDKDSWK